MHQHQLFFSRKHFQFFCNYIPFQVQKRFQTPVREYSNQTFEESPAIKEIANQEDSYEEYTYDEIDTEINEERHVYQEHPYQKTEIYQEISDYQEMDEDQKADSSSIVSIDPEVIDGIEISEEKGLYLVQLEDEKALIGVINSEVFVLQKFKEVLNPKIAVKKTESSGDKDIYFVQVGSWRSLVSSEPNRMNLELVF